MILGIKENMSLFAFTKVKKASNKFFFRLSKDGLVLAGDGVFDEFLAGLVFADGTQRSWLFDHVD